MIKLIIFDLDDTLFRSKDSYKHILAEVISAKWSIKERLSVEAFSQTEDEMRDARDSKCIKEFYSEFNKKFLKKILGAYPTKEQFREFNEILSEMKELSSTKLKLYPSVKEVLKRLKDKGYKLAILTGSWGKKIENFSDPSYAKKNREILEKLLENSSISKLIDKMFITYEHGVGKPNTKAFEIVLKHFNVKPEESVMVGDKESDMLASCMGIFTVLFDPKGRYDGKTKPDHKITNFPELELIIVSYN